MSESIAHLEFTTERRSAFSDRLPLLSAAATYALLGVLCALGAYWLMFRQFAFYDDEGFFDYSLKLFIHGHSLYTSDFSVYGPFYYEAFAALFGVLGQAVTTDAGRIVHLVIWLLSTFALGFTAHRLTGKLSIAVIALVVGFFLMSAMAAEPMHPEGLICALVVAMAAVAAFGVPRHPRASLCTLGALAAALCLTKVNAGGYAVIAIAFAVIMTVPSLYRFAVLRWVAVAAIVLVAPAVMIAYIDVSWAQHYAALVVLSALALALVAFPAVHDRAPDESAEWPVWLIVGFAGMAILVLGIIFALGTTPGALIDQVIVVPANKQGSALTVPLMLSGAVLWWSLASLVVAAGLRRTGALWIPAPSAPPGLWGGVLRLLAGLAILLSLVDFWPFEIAPSAAFALAMPLAWVAAIPSRRDGVGPRQRLVRLLIPSLAVLQCLVAYPVAGNQVSLSSVLLVLCGAVCVADGWSDLVAWSATRNVASFAGAGLTALFFALAVVCTLQLVVQPMRGWRTTYRNGVALSIPGATLLRLPAPEAKSYDDMVDLLQRHCGTVMELPGLYSFNLWSGLPTPTTLTGEQPYWKFLSSDQQLKMLAAAKASLGLCLVRNDQAASYNGLPPPRVPIINFIQNDFVPLAAYPPYLIELRR